MTTKTKPSRFVRMPSVHTIYSEVSNPSGYESWNYQDYTTASEVIAYEDYHRLPSGHWPWKECKHTVDGYQSIVCGYASDYKPPAPGRQGQKKEVWYNIPKASIPDLPNVSWDRSVLGQLLDQIDLNTDNAVLLYSGVLQAVPLLGSVSTFLRTFNRVVPNVLRRFRRRPFTEAVKSLISLDFIDRFVITPTLDDVRKFQDATDYVLRVIQTARERNEHRFALEATATVVTYKSESTGYLGGKSNFDGVSATFATTVSATSKAFMLLEASYNMTAVDPLKIWAQRVGLTRPLDSVWDLVPFSFVIDYFTRAGDFISALSDEMSRVQGLQGTITKIHDLWGTFLRRSERKVVPISQPAYSGVIGGTNFVWRPGQGIQKKEEFSRFRVTRPWEVLSSLQRGSIGDYLSVNLDLSSTRKRTLAELFIQAKL